MFKSRLGNANQNIHSWVLLVRRKFSIYALSLFHNSWPPKIKHLSHEYNDYNDRVFAKSYMIISTYSSEIYKISHSPFVTFTLTMSRLIIIMRFRQSRIIRNAINQQKHCFVDVYIFFVFPFFPHQDSHTHMNHIFLYIHYSTYTQIQHVMYPPCAVAKRHVLATSKKIWKIRVFAII